MQKIVNKKITVYSQNPYIDAINTLYISFQNVYDTYSYIFFFSKYDFPVIVVMQPAFPTFTVSRVSPGEYEHFSTRSAAPAASWLRTVVTSAAPTRSGPG